jgi:hypothetical protein
MYTIKTTDFFTDKGINKVLYDKTLIQTIADVWSENRKILAIYNTHYKIEFSFTKNNILRYVMIEEITPQEQKQPFQCEFIDDIDIFKKSLNDIKTLFKRTTTDNNITIDKVLIHFEDEKVDSLYYFPYSASTTNTEIRTTDAPL